MYQYPNSNVFVPASEHDQNVRKCPKCSGDTVDDGECSEGCCDYRKCQLCGYGYRIE